MKRLLSAFALICIGAMIGAAVIFGSGLNSRIRLSLEPTDYEECAEGAALWARSNLSLETLLTTCNAKFPARHSLGGGYVYRDNETGEEIAVSSPRVTSDDNRLISQARESYYGRIIDQQRRIAAENARQQETLAEQRRIAAQNKAQLAQAESDKQRRNGILASGVRILSKMCACSNKDETAMGGQCLSDVFCDISIENKTDARISSISISYALAGPTGVCPDCPSSDNLRQSAA